MKSIRQMPMVLAFLLFALGIVLSEYIPLPYEGVIYTVSILVVLSAIFIFPFRSIHYRTYTVILILTLCGSMHHALPWTNNSNSRLPENISSLRNTYTAELTSMSETENYYNLTVILRDLNHNLYGAFNIPVNLALVKIKKPNHQKIYEIGTVFKITMHLNPIQLSKTTTHFNYNNYLFRKGIRYIGFAQADDIHPAQQQSYSRWKIIRYHIRNKAINTFNSTIKDDKTKAILKALILGYKNDLDPEIKQNFQDSGTMHILAVSGLHVGIVALILFSFIDRLLFTLHKFSTIKIAIVILGLATFAELSGGAPPVWRAVLMTTIFLIGRSFSLETQNLNQLGLAAFILVLINSQNLFDVSFQFSFAAVTGIILCYPILSQLYTPKSEVSKYVIGILYMGISAQIALLPLSLHIFNQVSLLSPITSIFAISAAFCLIIGGIVLLVLGNICPIIITPLNYLLKIIIGILERITQVAAQLTFSILDNIPFDLFQTCLVSISILICLLAYYKNSFTHLTIGLSLLVIHGLYFSSKQISHSHCLEVSFDPETRNVKEVLIGKTAYLNYDVYDGVFSPDKIHKEHLITSKQSIKSIFCELPKTSDK